METAPTDRTVVPVHSDLSMTLCTNLADIDTCCPAGFTAVGFDPLGATLCLDG
jgi:hypothetical protein